MKKTYFLLAQIFIVAILGGCSSSDIEKPSISQQKTKAQIKKEAQDWFIKQSASLRNSSSQILYDNPSWRFTAVNQKGSEVAVDVDLTDVSHYNVLTEESFSCLKQNPNEWKYYRSQIRMVILSDTTLKDRKNGFLMVFLPSKEYIHNRYEHLQRNTYLHMDPLYDGRILFFDLSGTPLYGNRYENGKIASKITPLDKDSETPTDKGIFSTIGLKISYTVIAQKLRARPQNDDYIWDCGELDEVMVVGRRIEEGESLSDWIERRNRQTSFTMAHDWMDGGGGGNPEEIGGGFSNQIEDPHFDQEKLKDPCENMKSKSSNRAFMMLLKDLNELSSGPIEYGRTFTYDGKDFTFEVHNGTENGINFKPTSPFDGFIHTHNVDNNKHWRIFSGEDLVAMYTIYKEGFMRNIETFTMGLVVKDACYFLKITDSQAFKEFFSPGDVMDKDKLTSNINRMLAEMVVNLRTQEDVVNAFVHFINFNRMGLTLLEKKQNSFVRKSVDKDTNQIINVSC